MHTSLRDEHKTVIPLLDAYTTNTLTAAEKTLVEQHLASCQECQHTLTDISRLHTLLKLPLEDRQSLRLNEDSIIPPYRRGVSALADNVLDRITQMGGEHIASASTSAMAPLYSPHLPTLRDTRRRRNRVRWAVGLVAAVLCVAILSVLFAPAISQIIFKGNATKSVPSGPSIWRFQSDQISAAIRQGQDVFALEFIPVVNNNEFGLIYAYRSSNPGAIPHVEIISTLSSQPGNTIIIPSSNQTLGILGKFEIGIIDVRMQNRLGQTIILQGNFPDQTTPWQITLCTQQVTFASVSPNSQGNGGEYGAMLVDQKDLPEVVVKTPYAIDRHAYVATHRADLLSFTLLSSQETPKAATSLYIRLDYLMGRTPLEATVISQAEFIRLEGSQKLPPHGPAPTPLNPGQSKKMFTATATPK